MQLNAQGLGVFHGVDTLGTGQTLIVNVGDDQQAGTAVTVERIVDGAQAHGAHGGQQRHLAAFDDAHVMLVGAGLGVVHGVEGTDDAAHGLGERAVKICIRIIFEEVIGQQRLNGDVGILAVAAAVGVGVAGGHLRALIEVGGLNGEAVAGLILVLPVLAHGMNHTAELVAHDGGVFRHVVRHTLMLGTLDSGFIGTHTNAVRNNFDLHIIRADLRKVNLLQTKIHFSMNAHRFCLHAFVFLSSVPSAGGVWVICDLIRFMLFYICSSVLYGKPIQMSTMKPTFHQ